MIAWNVSFKILFRKSEDILCLLLFLMHRETIQQALRGILLIVGNKMGETVRENLTNTLLSLQSHAEVNEQTVLFTKIICNLC